MKGWLKKNTIIESLSHCAKESFVSVFAQFKCLTAERISLIIINLFKKQQTVLEQDNHLKGGGGRTG